MKGAEIRSHLRGVRHKIVNGAGDDRPRRPAVAGDGGKLLEDLAVQLDLPGLGKVQLCRVGLNHDAVVVEYPEAMPRGHHVVRLEPDDSELYVRQRRQRNQSIQLPKRDLW